MQFIGMFPLSTHLPTVIYPVYNFISHFLLLNWSHRGGFQTAPRHLPNHLYTKPQSSTIPTLTILLYCLLSHSIFNLFLTTGTFNSTLKHAHVLPILKKSSLDPYNLVNLRPISHLHLNFYNALSITAWVTTSPTTILLTSCD